VLVIQILPVLRQLRLLRTLPISTARLSTALILIMVMPLVAVGALAGAVAWLALGKSAGLTFLGCYAFILGPASLCVFLAMWRGEGMLAYVLVIVTLFGSQRVYGWLRYATYPPVVPWGAVGAIAVAGMVLGWLLTRWALEHSSQAYRVRLSPTGTFPWAGGR
jgi:hypothetical protein